MEQISSAASRHLEATRRDSSWQHAIVSTTALDDAAESGSGGFTAAARLSLAALLRLTADAVLVVSGTGSIVASSDRADALLGAGVSLRGRDLRDVLGLCGAPSDIVRDAHEQRGAQEPFALDDLPFPCDGTPCPHVVPLPGGPLALELRVEPLHPRSQALVVVAAPLPGEPAGDSSERALADLRRANHRLSGAMQIMLDTLASPDVRTLFGSVLEKLAETVEADGTVLYLTDADGYHLRAATTSVDTSRLPRYLALGEGPCALALRAGRALRLRVTTPSVEELRAGTLRERTIVDEDADRAHTVSAKSLPPFSSMMAVPVWFGGQIISVIYVGWEHPRVMPAEDARLLESVAHYLSVQLAGVLAQLRSERATRLSALGKRALEALKKHDPSEELSTRLSRALGVLAQGLEATLVMLPAAGSNEELLVGDPLSTTLQIPLWDDARQASPDASHVLVLPREVQAQLCDASALCQGILLDLGELRERGKTTSQRRRALMLRAHDAEPPDEPEVAFLERHLGDIRQELLGETTREQDKRISQALQSGMRNELQKVKGLTAQAVYSSATAEAFVGGDFYDLIRLPGQRACIIMGDVSGKGVEAASVSAAVKTALAAYAWEGLPPARMVRSLNDFLLGFSRLETFATLFVGIIDVARGVMDYCSAGHPPVAVVHAATEELRFLDVQSSVVGAFPDMAYRGGQVRLTSGDILLLYTDGTTEARDPVGAFFGEQGLRDALMRETSGELPFEGLVDRLLETLERFTERRLEDDVALLAVRIDE